MQRTLVVLFAVASLVVAAGRLTGAAERSCARSSHRSGSLM